MTRVPVHIAAMRGLGAAFMLLLLAGCGRGITSTPGDAPNLQKWVADVRARPAPPLDPLPVMQQFETFEYAAQDMRDPFSDAWSDPDGGSGLRPDPNRRKEPLEQIFADMKTGITKPQEIVFIDDRRHAIGLALEAARPGDSVLIAGKGHEPFQEFGDTVVTFDDRQIARELAAIKKIKAAL